MISQFAYFIIIKVTSHERHGISNHWPLDCLFNRLFRLTTKKTTNLRPTHLLSATCGFPSQSVCNAESVFMPWLHDSPFQWRHNGRDGVSNHRRLDCLLNRLFRRRSKKTSKHRVTGLCEGNSRVTGEFPAQKASNAENISIWWRHYAPGDSCHVMSPDNRYINGITKQLGIWRKYV